MMADRRNSQKSHHHNPSKPQTFKCVYDSCERAFNKKWNLQAHERLHTGQTPFACRLGCGEYYMWVSSRKGHERNKCRFTRKSPGVITTQPNAQQTRADSSGNGRRHKSSQKSDRSRNKAPSSSGGYESSATQPKVSRSFRKEHNIRRSQEDFLANGNSLDKKKHGTDLILPGDLLSDMVIEEVVHVFLQNDRVLEDIDLPDCCHFNDMFMERVVRREGSH